MLHKMFTLDDLYNFYNSQNKTCIFNSKESNSTIIVQIPEIINFSDDYNPTYNLLPVHLMSCHLLENRNKSSISRKAMNEAIPSFCNRPILGYIQKIDDGDGNYHYDFAGHEMEFDDEGNIEYKEKVVGIIPESCNPKIVYNEEYKKDYLEVDGIIFEDYSHAAEILRDKGKCDVSIEISVDMLSYDSKAKVMNIEQFHFLGVTILGVTTDENHRKIEPGMIGSNITIADFSEENNSIVFNKQELIDEVTTAVIKQLSDKANFAEENYGKEENMVTENNENMNVEFEETEVDEVETKEVEMEEAEVEATEEETPVVETEASNEETDEAVETPEVVDEFADGDPEPAGEDSGEDDSEPAAEDSDADEGQSTSAIEDEDSTGTVGKNVNIIVGEKTFELSLDDVNYSINCLVNDMYSETDNTYYMTVVYPESKYLIMIDAWNSARAFKQSYKDRKGVFSLVGERIPVRSIWVTSDEEAELDKIRSNYSSIESELNSYKSKELHSAREEVLNSECYSVMSEYDDFNNLKEHMDDYSVEELTEKADLVYAQYMKSTFSTFAENQPKKKTSVVFMASSDNTNEEKLPYGGLFKNYKFNNKN